MASGVPKSESGRGEDYLLHPRVRLLVVFDPLFSISFCFPSVSSVAGEVRPISEVSLAGSATDGMEIVQCLCRVRGECEK